MPIHLLPSIDLSKLSRFPKPITRFRYESTASKHLKITVLLCLLGFWTLTTLKPILKEPWPLSPSTVSQTFSINVCQCSIPTSWHFDRASVMRNPTLFNIDTRCRFQPHSIHGVWVIFISEFKVYHVWKGHKWLALKLCSKVEIKWYSKIMSIGNVDWLID